MSKLQLYYDKNGHPIEDTLKWNELCEDDKYRYVKQETLSNGVFISIIWTGLDMSLNGQKLIFETAAFVKNEQENLGKYSTLEDAEAAHARAVLKYRFMKIDPV
ncbi:hypothetical protein HFN20_26565 [Paenibacillus dendritiformis]|uniref:hypothetical protein n=1 Tax=Paenibacillus dendritiformis TaxID=130049 RepID=UPI00143E0283|nr:hypothetical protein [Paenibacillus dendritiformis]NKI24719.1 hypothetical protein [Paenibacillus dendritiformis]NRG01580.1 hypothetical protein [Paenibacillus dendritiformis]